MSEDLKTIQYRGGLVTFRVPSHWREEYEPDGGADFFEDAPDSPTFRLYVTTFRAPFVIAPDSSRDLLASMPQASHGIQRLPSGLALIRFAQPAADRGHRLLITCWLLAHPLPPAHARLANFSFTILERQQHDPKIQATLHLLDSEIRAASFFAELGVMQE